MKPLKSFGFWSHAEQYLLAAEKVKKPAIPQKGKSRFKLILPAYYLVGHSIELSLKSFLSAKGYSHSELRKQKYGHDLESLLSECTRRKLGREVNLSKIQVQGILLIKCNTPEFFENLVVHLIVSMGYGGSVKEAGKATRKTADEGIDGVIKEDRLGLDTIYLQAKRWETVVGRPEIQKFVGALHGQRAKKGVFITTSRFSKEALDYVGQIDPKVVLIDGADLVQLMIDHGVGVSSAAVYEVKKVDIDFFIEE